MRKYLRDYGYLLTLAGLIIGLDQWTKALVRSSLDFEEIWSPWHWLIPYARIVHWKNTGAAFGVLQGFGGVFTVLAIVVALAILYYFPQVPRHDWTLRLAMAMQFGGALGNLIDRLTQGYVTDFISLGAFPVFNVADASISIGTAILILGMWYRERHPPDLPALTGSPGSVWTGGQPTVAKTGPTEPAQGEPVGRGPARPEGLARGRGRAGTTPVAPSSPISPEEVQGE